MKAKQHMRTNKQGGFTLLEVMIVVGILAILASMAAPSVTGFLAKAEGQKIVDTVTKVNSEIASLAKLHRFTSCASSERFVNTGNSFLDVIYNGGAFVQSSYRTSYERGPHANYTKMFNEMTAATAGSAGTYQVESMPFSIQTCTADENVYRLENVNTEVLESLLESAYPAQASAFSASTAVTTGPIRYTAADSNELHQVDFYLKR